MAGIGVEAQGGGDISSHMIGGSIGGGVEGGGGATASMAACNSCKGTGRTDCDMPSAKFFKPSIRNPFCGVMMLLLIICTLFL